MANVKILPGKSNKERQKIINAQRTAATQNAASGLTASRLAGVTAAESSKGKTIKVNSNPVLGKTTVSPMAKVRGRILGGGMGGMFGIKNR